MQIGVASQAPNVKEATDKAGEMTSKLVDLLKANKIEPKDIQTNRFNIQQIQKQKDDDEEDDGIPEIVGYKVSTSINTTIRGIDKVEEIIQAVTSAGNYLFNGITFDIDNRNELHKDAIKLAMSDAREKAEVAAESESKQIGGVSKITVDSSHYSPKSMRGSVMLQSAMLGGGGGMPIEAGELSVPASVSIEYLLEKKQ